jgi:hypothetical protein
VDGGQSIPPAVTSTEFDILADRIGAISTLTTTDKSSTVGAINEVNAVIDAKVLTYNTDYSVSYITGVSNSSNPRATKILNHFYSLYMNIGIDSATVTIPARTEMQIGTISIVGKTISGATICPVQADNDGTRYSAVARIASTGAIYISNNEDVSIAGNIRIMAYLIVA